MNRTPSLDGPQVKIAKAMEHFRRLEQEVRQFRASNPYRIVREENAQLGGEHYRFLYRVRVSTNPPVSWAAIIGDTVHNLRSALDFLAWQLVLANGAKPTKRTAFPISRSGDDFESTGIRMVKGASDEAMRIIRSLNPYKGGDDNLWRLHQLDIIDKHHLLIPVGVAYASVGIQLTMPAVDWLPSDVEMPRVWLRPADRLFPLEDGAVLFGVREGVEDDTNPQFAFDVTFGEDETVQGEPLVRTLSQLGGRTEQVVNLFAPLFSA